MNLEMSPAYDLGALAKLEMSHYLEMGREQGEGLAPPQVQRRVELSPALSITLDRYFACA